MPSPSIEVEGLKELRKKLRQVKDSALNDEMKAIHVALAAEITRRALPRVPVDSGALKASVRSSGTVRDAVGRVGKKAVPYAPIIHWGWPKRGIPRRQFLRDAAEVLERDIVDRYDDAVASMLERVITRGR